MCLGGNKPKPPKPPAPPPPPPPLPPAPPPPPPPAPPPTPAAPLQDPGDARSRQVAPNESRRSALRGRGKSSLSIAINTGGSLPGGNTGVSV